MRLRPYNSTSDYPYVEKWVENERIHALWCANLIPYPLSEDSLREFLEKDAREWGGCAFVATEDNGVPMGFFVYSLNLAENTGFMKLILLDGRLRGRGYGPQMCRLALKYAFEITGAQAVQLNVFDVNARARKCYEKAGFRQRSITEAALQYGEEQWGRLNMAAERDYWLDHMTEEKR